MRYIWQHIEVILSSYKGDLPLTHFLKRYFKQHHKLGSRDRKILSDMLYSWYRCERGITDTSNFEEKMIACLTLCKSKWSEHPLLAKGIGQKDIEFEIHGLLKSPIELSAGIEKQEWLSSMLSQPDLFIRIRKDKEKVTDILKVQDIPFTFITDTCISLPNSAPIDKLLSEDSYVVQDASSQKTGAYFRPKKNEAWYDCCAGAGGKSLLLKDIEAEVRLTVSDKRESILHNLKDRFKQYGNAPPRSVTCDVADEVQLQKELGDVQFDNIICDVPCSGSGTWARTPEQLYFFEPASLPKLCELQKKIAVNMIPYLKDGGRLIYITCSVFKEENEDIINELLNTNSLSIEQMELINGIGLHADSMFVCALKKKEKL